MVNCGCACTSGFHPYDLDCVNVAAIGLRHAHIADLSERMIAIYADYKRAALQGRSGEASPSATVTTQTPPPTASSGEHDAKKCAATGFPCLWPECTEERQKLAASAHVEVPIKLDLGCGKNKRPGFVGVDSIQFPGVDVVTDLSLHAWPWSDGAVEEAHCSHMLEHIPAKQRPHFFNELFRVLKPGGKATIITPHWCSNRAYGDLTHEWPPVSEMFYWYLNAAWRADNAPHQRFWTCDFDTVQPGYSLHPELQLRGQDYRNRALAFDKEAAQDMYCTIIKREPKP